MDPIEAAVAIFGSSQPTTPPTPLSEADVQVYLKVDPADFDMSALQARDPDAAVQCQAFEADADAFVMSKGADGRVEVYAWMAAGDDTEPFPSAAPSPAAAAPPPPAAAPPAAPPPTTTTAAAAAPSPTRPKGATPSAPVSTGPASGIPIPVGPQTTATPVLPAGATPSAATPPSNLADGKKRDKGKKKDKDKDQPPPPRTPLQSLRSASLPAVTLRILASTRWQGLFTPLKTLFANSRSGDASAAGGIGIWSGIARNFRDGAMQPRRPDDSNFGRLILRLIEALERRKDETDPDWFKTNFETGTIPSAPQAENTTS